MLNPGDVVDLVEIRNENDPSLNKQLLTEIMIYSVHSDPTRWKLGLLLDSNEEKKLAASKYPNDIVCYFNSKWIAEQIDE